MLVLSFFVKKTLAKTLNSNMLAAAHITLVFASDSTTELLIQKKRLRSCQEVVNCRQMMFADD